MKRSLLVVCLFAGVCLLLFPTTGAPSAQSPTADDLELSATSAHNGAYTTTDGDQLQLQIGYGERGLNDEAITTIDSLFELTYTGSGSATVWLEAPVSGVQFYRGSNPEQPIDSEETITMASGEAVRVGILLDTTESPLGQFEVFRIGIRKPGTDSADDTEQIAIDPEGPTDGGGSEGNSPDDGPRGPDDPPTDPGGDQQDGEGGPPTTAPPIDLPNIPLPDVDPGPILGDGVGLGGDATGQGSDGSGATAGSVTEPGTTPNTTQTSLAGIRWILLLVSGAICGALVSVALRRFGSGGMS